MTNRARAAIGIGVLLAAVLLAFVVAKLTTRPSSAGLNETAGSTVASPTSAAVPSSGVPTSESASPSGSPSETSSSASPTSGSPSSAAPTTTAAAPAPPLTTGQLIRQLRGCATGKCTVISTFESTQSGTALRFALVRMPVTGDASGEVPLRAALFDTKKQVLTYASPVLTGVPATGADGAARQDATGHIAFTLFMGAHSSDLFVLDPADGTHVKWFDQPGNTTEQGWFSNTGGAHAEDLDGDGVLELVVPENDYSPDYATGSDTVYRFAWNGSSAYAMTGCTYYPHGAKKGTDYDATDAKCAAN
jgi:hypothetical protein